jgi:hypothetical protein
MNEANHPNPQEGTSAPVRGDVSAERLVPDDATKRDPTPDDAIPLVGYIGDGVSEDSLRLYRNMTMKEWIEIPKVAIIARFSEAGDGELTKGRSLVVVSPSAILLKCEVVRASRLEKSVPLDQPAAADWPPGPGWW